MALTGTPKLTKDTFDEGVSANDFVIIDFWAEWCGPCRAFGPVFERVSDRHQGIVFAKVDTEAGRTRRGRSRSPRSPPS